MLKKIFNTGFLHVFGSEVINKIIIFLSGVVLVRIIPKEEYGSYAYAQNIYNFFMILSGMGLANGILQICCEKPKEEAWEYYKKGSKWAILFNLILQIIMVLVSMLFVFPVQNASVYFRFLSILPVAYLSIDLVQIYNRYTIENKKYAYLSIVNTACVFFIGVIGALLFKVIGLIVFQFFGYLLTIVYAIIIQKFPVYNWVQNTKIQLREWKALIKISLIAILNNSASTILYNLDVFVLGIVMTDETIIASYKVATYIPNALSFIPTALVIYIFPHFVKKSSDKAWIKKSYLKLIKWFMLFNFLLVSILVFFAPLLIRIVFGKQYLDSIGVFRILTISYFFNATFRNTTGNILASQRKYNINFVIGVLAGIINVAGDFFLIPIWGGAGAAITTLAVTIVSSILMIISFLNYLRK